MNDWDYMITMQRLKRAMVNPHKPIEMPIYWERPSALTPAAIKLAVSLLDDDLADLEDYFEDKADYCTDLGPNKEMDLSNAVKRIRAQLNKFKLAAEKEMK